VTRGLYPNPIFLTLTPVTGKRERFTAIFISHFGEYALSCTTKANASSSHGTPCHCTSCLSGLVGESMRIRSAFPQVVHLPATTARTAFIFSDGDVN
jgi:hypothetical protein